jgi:streptomycin 6-kinase
MKHTETTMTAAEIVQEMQDARGRRLLAERRLKAAALAYGQTGDLLDLQRLATTAREYWLAHRAVDETATGIAARRA